MAFATISSTFWGVAYWTGMTPCGVVGWAVARCGVGFEVTVCAGCSSRFRFSGGGVEVLCVGVVLFLPNNSSLSATNSACTLLISALSVAFSSVRRLMWACACASSVSTGGDELWEKQPVPSSPAA